MHSPVIFWNIRGIIALCSCCAWILLTLGLAEGASSHKKTAYVDGDIMIGALFAMHEQPEHRRANSGDRTCGKIWEQYGIQRLEATLKTIEQINADPRLLPNITLGVEIRDDCWYSPVALEQTIEFIRESIAAQTGGALDKSDQTEEACVVTATDDGNALREIIPQKKRKKNFVGVIGPGSSSVTIQVQNLLQLFSIPQIGYSATSPDLSDKTSYKYFLRVVPSDRYQAAAMLDIIVHHNWTYISAMCTKGSYGTSGLEAFKSLAKKSGICIATEDTISSNPDDKEYERVVMSFLRYYPNAKVIACFCEGQTVTGLFNAMRKLGVSGKFLLIGSDGWADRTDVVSGVEQEAVGGISIRIQSPYLPWFDEHYFALNPWTNERNPWFKEFWSAKFECVMPELLTSDFSTLTANQAATLKYNRTCDGSEQIRPDRYKQDTKMGFVVDSIYTLAHGLHNMHSELCGKPGLCTEMETINGSLLLDYLMGVNFTGVGGHTITFDENGDPPGRYDIMNFQQRRSSYGYHKVGEWDNGKLKMEQPLMHNPKTERNEVSKVVESVCSKPCRRGEVKAIQTGGVKCCWVCTACKLNEFLLDEFTCEACPPGWLPNENLTACLPITLEYASLDSGSTQAVVGITFSCLGFLATGFTMIVFILHNNTTVVKASTRELSYTILVGIFLCYATAFPLFAKPTKFTCYLTRILPGFSFAIIYGALLTKTNRIARILAAGKKKIMTRKPRFMSALAQVVITWIIIGVEVAILSASLIHEPADSILYYPEVNRARLICNTSAWGIIAPMGFELFLIVMCTVYAIKTRNLPENFNEAKFIGFTMYTTCVVWMAFFPIYFGSDAKVLTMTLCISFSATVALCLLFFPKLYIILFRPERNNRSAFTTTNQVRCHIGSNNINNKSLDSNSAERPYGLFRRQRITTERSASLTRTETLLQRFSIRRPKRLSETSVRNSLSFDSPSASFSQENHVENHRQVYGNLKTAAPSRRVTRMSDVMEETSTAFGREDTTDHPSHVSRLDAECQTGNELLQALVDQIIPTPTLRRRRRSLLMMCNEIEEELLSPSVVSNTNWYNSDARSVSSQIDSTTGKSSSLSKHSSSNSRQVPDNISTTSTLNRIESGSSLGVAALPDNITLTSSRVSLASLASSIQLLNQLSDANMDSESLQNLRDWLADQGVLLTDLQTSTL